MVLERPMKLKIDQSYRLRQHWSHLKYWRTHWQSHFTIFTWEIFLTLVVCTDEQETTTPYASNGTIFQNNFIFLGKSMSGQPIATCSQCGVTFRSFSGLYHHQKTHEGQLYKCPEPGCNKEYKTEHLLRRHLKVHRDHREGNLKCPHCEKTFCRADYLEIHIKRHLGQKDEKCPECGKGKFFTSN